MSETDDVLKRLRTLRERKSLRQEHVARLLGVDRTTYLRKEKGHIPITTEEWLRLAHALGEDPGYFFGLGADKAGNAAPDLQETLLLRLFRALGPEEKQDLLFSVRLILKGVDRKDVQDALARLLRA